MAQTKLCKHCKTEIDKKAKVCPNCKKKQSGPLKIVLIVLAVIVVIAAIGGSGGEDEEVKKTTASNSDVTSTDTNNVSETEAPAEKTEFVVGEAAESDDFKISFLSAEQYASDNEFLQPEEGNVYYRVEFEIENKDDSDMYISSYDFECYADGYSTTTPLLSDGLLSSTTLSSGKKAKGYIYYEIPQNAESIVVEYETNFWTENKITFVVK